jgi:hypothetical protein
MVSSLPLGTILGLLSLSCIEAADVLAFLLTRSTSPQLADKALAFVETQRYALKTSRLTPSGHHTWFAILGLLSLSRIGAADILAFFLARSTSPQLAEVPSQTNQSTREHWLVSIEPCMLPTGQAVSAPPEIRPWSSQRYFLRKSLT